MCVTARMAPLTRLGPPAPTLPNNPPLLGQGHGLLRGVFAYEFT